MFTGDGSGEFLYQALYNAGFANQPEGISRDDGLELSELFITAVCRCVPPANKPKAFEISNCLPYMKQEIDLLGRMEGVVALGGIAFDYTLRLLREDDPTIPRLKFAHGAFYELSDDLPWMLASYHPSRQNTQTGRLTEEMFEGIWGEVKVMLKTGE
jgi:uracil-DNA glycosylase family 4